MRKYYWVRNAVFVLVRNLKADQVICSSKTISIDIFKRCCCTEKIFSMPFYAVARGKNTGVYPTWAECQEQICGFKGAVYKKFETETEAEEFVKERASFIVDKRTKAESSSEDKKISAHAAAENGRLSPALVEMKKEVKLMQKQLSSLRGRFDEYVNSRTNPSDKSETTSKRKSEKDDHSHSAKKTKLIQDSKERKSDDKSKFNVDDNGFLILYTDGACEFNGRNGSRAGIGVYFGADHPMNVSEPVKGRATNNTAEIQAGTMAVELTKAAGFDKVIINTDSQFMINCMTSWLPSWKKNNWKKKDGAEVINKEDLITLDRATEGLLIKWNHIKGHNGNPGNEAADKLARSGAKRYIAEKAEKAEAEKGE